MCVSLLMPSSSDVVCLLSGNEVDNGYFALRMTDGRTKSPTLHFKLTVSPLFLFPHILPESNLRLVYGSPCDDDDQILQVLHTRCIEVLSFALSFSSLTLLCRFCRTLFPLSVLKVADKFSRSIEIVVHVLLNEHHIHT